MKTAFAALFCTCALAACAEEFVAQEDVIPAPCKAVVFEETPLTLCTADPAEHTISLALGPANGKPWQGLAAFAAARAADAQPVAFAMNAGMFDEQSQPIGYYVENGERMRSLNRNKGPGNFHLLPNGVFFGGDGAWEVRETQDFYDNVTQRPRFGTQSGPMLVIAGELHSDIDPDGDSRKIRNAVGVDSAGRALFVISDAPISFGKLARYYRDALKVPNALFLDGTVSSLWSPATGRFDNAYPLGPLIVVEKRAKAPQNNETAP